MLSGRLASTLELLFIEQHRLGVLVLLAGGHIYLRLIHAGTAHCVEFIDLHLRWLGEILGLVVVLDRDVAHGLADWLLPQLLLGLLIVVCHLAGVLHGHGAVGASASGGIAVLADRVQALAHQLLRPFRSVVQADLRRVGVRLLALLRPVLLVARLRVHIRFISVAVRAAHDLRRLDLRVALMIHVVALGVGRAAALVLAVAVHLLCLSEAGAARRDPVLHLHAVVARLLHVN